MSIGQRLDDFAKSVVGDAYGYKAKFARKLGINRNTLSLYIFDKLIPGNSLHTKLRELGCDIEWLMTGKRRVVIEGREIEVIDRSVIEEGIKKTQQEELCEQEKELLSTQFEKLQQRYVESDLRCKELQNKVNILNDKVIALLEEKEQILRGNVPNIRAIDAKLPSENPSSKKTDEITV